MLSKIVAIGLNLVIITLNVFFKALGVVDLRFTGWVGWSRVQAVKCGLEFEGIRFAPV